MPHDAHRIIEDTLRDLPLRCRLAYLGASVLVTDDVKSIGFLIELAQILARRLPAEKQTAVAWHLAEVLSELEATWS